MKAVFIELPPFERYRQEYFDDDAFLQLQQFVDAQPGSGCFDSRYWRLAEVRFGDERRGKGKRGGLRVIYYWWDAGLQFWLFTIYDKDEKSDLTKAQRKVLKQTIKKELEARKQ